MDGEKIGGELSVTLETATKTSKRRNRLLTYSARYQNICAICA